MDDAYAFWKEAYACLVQFRLSGFHSSFEPFPNLLLGSLFKVVFDRHDSIVIEIENSGYLKVQNEVSTLIIPGLSDDHSRLS